jgi:hypothetical protein
MVLLIVEESEVLEIEWQLSRRKKSWRGNEAQEWKMGRILFVPRAFKSRRGNDLII